MATNIEPLGNNFNDVSLSAKVVTFSSVVYTNELFKSVVLTQGIEPLISLLTLRS